MKLLVPGARLTLSLIALAAVLAATTAAGFVAARHYYIASKVARLDPIKRKADQAFFYVEGVGKAGKTSPPGFVVIIGDSRVAQWPDPPQLTRPPFLLRRGVSGETTAQTRARFERDAFDPHPEAIVIETGINDLVAATLVPDREKEIVADAADNIAAMVAAARAAKIPVILMTVVQPADPPLWRRPFWSEHIRALVTELNTKIKAMEGPGVRILDAAALLGGVRDRIAPANAKDTLHFTPQAYDILNSALTRALGPDAVQ